MFENSSPGDRIILHKSNGDLAFTKIHKITEKQIVILRKGISDDYEMRFWKHNGREVGNTDKWHWNTIYESTPELVEETSRQHLRAKAVQLLTNIKVPNTKAELEKFVVILETLTALDKSA